MRTLFFILFLSVIYLNSKTQNISDEDLIKYQKVYEYIINDSIINNKSVYVSDIIVDMDRFGFIDKKDCYPELKLILDSLIKYSWEDDIQSEKLHNHFKKINEQNYFAESIMFFSLIEKNTLRVDLFLTRNSLSEVRYGWVKSYTRDKIFAYLFYFEKDSIKNVFRQEVFMNHLFVSKIEIMKEELNDLHHMIDTFFRLNSSL